MFMLQVVNVYSLQMRKTQLVKMIEPDDDVDDIRIWWECYDDMSLSKGKASKGYHL